MGQAGFLASGVAEADRVQHRMALEQGPVAGHTVREPDAMLLCCARRWANVTKALLSVFVLHLSSLDSDSLIHQGGEVGKVMSGKIEPEV